MIRHVVFFSAKDPADLPEMRAGLSILSDIPHASHWELGENLALDQISGDAVDLVVYAEFADEAALAAYKAHPLYARSIAHVRPLRELRLAADFRA